MAGNCGDPCGNNPIHYNSPFKPTQGNCGCTDASNIIYTGVALPCSSIQPNTNLEDVIKALDAKVCQAAGDYSTYNTHCLAGLYTITTEAQFVSAITDYACNLSTSFTTFTGTTFPASNTNLQNQINALVNPNLTLCTYSGVVSSDTQNGINTKFANKLCDLNSRLDISSVDWDNCYTVVTPPTTIPAAFQLLADQVCQAATTGASAALPTFNNQGSCLPAPLGTADSLVLTINKIKTRLCQSPVYDINTSPWGCIANPAAGTGPNIQAAFDATLPILNSLYGSRYSFDSDQFILTQNTPGNTCSGFTVSLDPSIGITDNKVGATLTDTNPSYLQDKLEAGTNITLDYTNPEKAVINSTFTDTHVKTSAGDPSAGYLQDKVIAGSSSNGVSIGVTTVSNQLVVAPTVDTSTLATNIMQAIQNDINLYNQFCELACGCAPCTETTTTIAPTATLRLFLQNDDTANYGEIQTFITQNNPTVSLESIGYNIAANGSTTTGFHPLTSTILPRTLNITLVNPGRQTYDIQVAVGLGGSFTPISGTTAFTTTNFSSYTNTSFNIGSLSGDIVLRIILTNVTPV